MATELFSNNARGVLAQAITSQDTELTLDNPETPFEWPGENEMGGMSFQRATLFHPSNPEEFEIVFIVGRAFDGDTLYIERGQEGSSAVDWPANTVIEARVTAGMLESFSGKADPVPVDGETGFPYLTKVTKVPENSYPSSETPMFASMVTGCSVNVSLGTPKSWGIWAISEGEIVTHPGAPNAYFVALDRWRHEQQLPALPDPQEGVTESGVVVLESDTETPCRFYAQRTDKPITIQLNGDGIGMVVTEVGFVSIQNDGAGPAQISVSVGGVQLVQSTPINEPVGSVVRFFNQSQRLAPTDSIQVNVLTRSAGEMKGYFYWVGFSAGSI